MEKEERIAKWRAGREAEAAVAAAERVALANAARDQRLAEAAQTSARRADDVRLARLESSAAEEANRIEIATTLLPNMQDIEQAREVMLAERVAASRARMRTALLAVGVPTLITAAYFAFVATPFYETHVVFAVQSATGQPGAPAAGIFSLGMPSSTLPDAFEAREYILSREMMNEMDARHGFTKHYSAPGIDPLSAPRTMPMFGIDAYSNYRRRVHVDVDMQAALLTVTVQARNPNEAVAYVDDLLALAQKRINDMSSTVTADREAALRREVRRAESEYLQTRASISSAQTSVGELSPEQTATTVYQVIGNLETQVADAERQHDSLLANGLTESPLLPRLAAKISQIRAQITNQRARLTGGKDDDLQRSTSRLESVTIRRDLARDKWQASLRTLEQARLTGLDQKRYLMIVAKPVTPSIATVNAWPYAAVLVAILSALFSGAISITRLLRQTRAR